MPTKQRAMTSCVKNKYKETNSDGGYEDAAELHNQNSEMESQIQGGIGLHEKTVFSEMKLGENTKMNTDNALEEIKKKKKEKWKCAKIKETNPTQRLKRKQQILKEVKGIQHADNGNPGRKKIKTQSSKENTLKAVVQESRPETKKNKFETTHGKVT